MAAKAQARLEVVQEPATEQVLETIGGLAAGIAHELNTPAQFLGDSLRFLSEAFVQMRQVLATQRKVLTTAAARDPVVAAQVRAVDEACEADAFLETLEDADEAIDAALEGVQRIGDIVHSVKAFAYRDDAVRERLDVNAAVRSAVRMSRGAWRDVAEVTTSLADGLPAIVCNRTEISQAILNLVVNAGHALADRRDGPERCKGTISITTRARDGGVVVAVSDDGPGIPAEIQGKILEPFFTTKPVGKGTGLGLPLSRASVVDRQGGTLTFASEPGRGASFEIWLPARRRKVGA